MRAQDIQYDFETKLTVMGDFSLRETQSQCSNVFENKTYEAREICMITIAPSHSVLIIGVF
jgi:hypothetical protein